MPELSMKDVENLFDSSSYDDESKKLLLEILQRGSSARASLLPDGKTSEEVLAEVVKRLEPFGSKRVLYYLEEKGMTDLSKIQFFRYTDPYYGKTVEELLTSGHLDIVCCLAMDCRKEK